MIDLVKQEEVAAAAAANRAAGKWVTSATDGYIDVTGIAPPKRKVAEAQYEEGLHPRDRLGKWVRRLGFKAYKVGGAVRDPLLGKEPKDEDFMVMAAPEEIKAAVEREGGVAEDLVVRDRLVGVRAHVPGVTPPEGVELAPPRIEVSTGPSRHDFVIEPHPAVTTAYGKHAGLDADELLAAEPDGEPGVTVARTADELSVVERDESGKPVGVAWARLKDGKPTAAAVVAVRSDVRRQGIGGRLLARARAEGVDLTAADTDLTPEGRHLFDAVALRDDARRRDFTANAIYEDADTGEIVDPLGGAADVQAGRLEVISDESFAEDPLRILRGLRFQSQHGLVPSERTLEQMREHAGAITALTQGGVSGTAQVELNKMLMGEHVGKALRTMRDTGVLASFLPELAPAIGFDQESKYHDLPLDEHIISAVEGGAGLDAPLEVRLALLFHDAGKPAAAWRGADGRLHYYASAEHGKADHAVVGEEIARAALRRLNYPRATIDRVGRLVRYHMIPATSRPSKVRRWRAEVGPDLIDDLLLHRRADMGAKAEGDEERNTALDDFAARVSLEADAPASLKDLAIGGRDLAALGIEGPRMGEILRGLLRDVIADPSRNEREWLLAQATRRIVEGAYDERLHPRDRYGRWRRTLFPAAGSVAEAVEQATGGRFEGDPDSMAGAPLRLPDGNVARVKLRDARGHVTIKDIEVADRGKGVGLAIVAGAAKHADQTGRRIFLDDIRNVGFARRVEREIEGFEWSGPELWRREPPPGTFPHRDTPESFWERMEALGHLREARAVMIDWDPRLHPRNRRGQFRDVLGRLPKPKMLGGTIGVVDVKDSPFQVARTKRGFVVANTDTGTSREFDAEDEAAGYVDGELKSRELKAEAEAELKASQAERGKSMAAREERQARLREEEAELKRRREEEFDRRYPKDEQGRRYYHRLYSETQDDDVARQQQESGEIWGRPAANTLATDRPAVKAYMGRLPEGKRGVEFVTDVPPDPNVSPGYGWWSTDPDGEKLRIEQDFAKLRVEITKNTQLSE